MFVTCAGRYASTATRLAWRSRTRAIGGRRFTGACTLGLHAIENRELGRAEPDPTFLVSDATVERTRLAVAGVDVTEIREPVAGVQVFDARDPDGNRFSLESRAAPRG